MRPVIDHEFRHHIVKVAVDPRGDSQVDPQIRSAEQIRPSTLQRRIRFENAFIPSVRMLKSTRRMRI